MAFKDKLKELLDQKGMKPADLARSTELSEAVISNYLNGKREPMGKMCILIAKALDVSLDELLESPFADANKNMVPDNLSQAKIDNTLSGFNNILPIETRRIPLLGDIACGEPIYANEDFESYVDAGADVKADFALRAKGDSMIGARIHDGDVVFIRRQPDVCDGDIAAIILDDEATLKRVYKTANGCVLQAENPSYAPIIVGGPDETREVRILGKAIAFQSNVR